MVTRGDDLSLAVHWLIYPLLQVSLALSRLLLSSSPTASEKSFFRLLRALRSSTTVASHIISSHHSLSAAFFPMALKAPDTGRPVFREMATVRTGNPRSHSDYTIGWVCALSKELTVATAMLDVEHEDDLPIPEDDHNIYTRGSIGDHNIVIACLPEGIIGTNSAAAVVKEMLRTFLDIRFGLMVGIGGGIPNVLDHDVRLGDVVVSVPQDTYSGVVQWDLGKAEQEGFKRTGSLNHPPKLLLAAVTKLRARHERKGPQIQAYLDHMAK